MRKDIVAGWLEKSGQSLSEGQFKLLARYQEMVLAAPMNLTAITGDEDFAIKHFIDSFTLLPWVDKLGEDTACIDIGTGAGFPGVPLKIARPDLTLTLLDSLQKRVLFLRSAAAELGLRDVECIHARAEDLVRLRGTTATPRAGLRQKDRRGGVASVGSDYCSGAASAGSDCCSRTASVGSDCCGDMTSVGNDYLYGMAFARAVARLDVLAGYALPLVKPGGVLLAMKGPDPADEIENAKPAIHKLGGIIESVETVEIAQGMGRTIIAIQKGGLTSR